METVTNRFRQQDVSVAREIFWRACKCSRFRKKIKRSGGAAVDARELDAILFKSKDALVIGACYAAPDLFEIHEDEAFWGMVLVKNRDTGTSVHFPRRKLSLIPVGVVRS